MKIGIQKTLFVFLMTLMANGMLFADQHFNKKIVETFSDMIDDMECHYAGIDQDNDGFTDIFITVIGVNLSAYIRRIAGLLKEGASVSYDDTKKKTDPYLGTYTIEDSDLLEVEGRSMLLYFPTARKADFPFEFARQGR